MSQLSNMPRTYMSGIDLNLLRVFDAIYASCNISRAAERLGMSQPATSQALNRLRLALRDPLFERTAGGVRPTERANRLAKSIQSGLALLDAGVNELDNFDPATSHAELRLHLTDIGEMRFLPKLMEALRQRAPGVHVQAKPWPQQDIAAALHSQDLHFAIGFLPDVQGTSKVDLLNDRYLLLLRAGHPALHRRTHGALNAQEMELLDFVSVRSHTETRRILQILRLEHRIRLTTSSFLALPAIVRSTDMGVIMPKAIAEDFEPRGEFALVEPDLPQRNFTVSLHWSRRHGHDPLLRWTRELFVELFGMASA